jgi:hypothetical protein
MPIQRVLGELNFLRNQLFFKWNLFQTLLRKEKANYEDVVSHVAGFEDGIIECKN